MVDCSLQEAKQVLTSVMEDESYGNLIYIDTTTQFLMRLEHDKKRGSYQIEVISGS
jgi:hypothetical protein